MTATLHAHVTPAAFFAEHGYYVARGLFADRIASLEPAFDRIVSQLSSSDQQVEARWRGEESDRLNRGGRVFIHTHNVQMYDAVWNRIWYEDRFLDLAEAMLGSYLVLHHTKLFQKPAERGAAFPMHQDFSYFPVEGDRCLAAIVHVSNADEQTGCLRIVPGSHKLGRLDDSAGNGKTSDLQRRFPLESGTIVPCEAGDVVFFHCLTIHGSGVNTHPTAVRKTVLIQLYDGKARPEPNGHPNVRTVLRGRNLHMTRNDANR